MVRTVSENNTISIVTLALVFLEELSPDFWMKQEEILLSLNDVQVELIPLTEILVRVENDASRSSTSQTGFVLQKKNVDNKVLWQCKVTKDVAAFSCFIFSGWDDFVSTAGGVFRRISLLDFIISKIGLQIIDKFLDDKEFSGADIFNRDSKYVPSTVCGQEGLWSYRYNVSSCVQDVGVGREIVSSASRFEDNQFVAVIDHVNEIVLSEQLKEKGLDCLDDVFWALYFRNKEFIRDLLNKNLLNTLGIRYE